jgi:hypothetical protein
MIQYIKPNPKENDKNKYVLVRDNICKVALLKGKDAFIEAAEKLVLEECSDVLEFKEELCLEIPNNKLRWTDKNYLEEYLEDKATNLDYKLFGFHFDLGVADPLTSIVLQIVDDNVLNFQRRNNILNPMYKYIGVSNKKLEGSFCIYITFAG